MNTKDYFSGHSKLYATFRPSYPEALYEFIFRHVVNKNNAWDCATGNGQVASYLAGYFETVQATDISKNQLDNAIEKNNIIYSISPAEKTSFNDNQFDLITVGQALHWFNADAFYKEVNRVSKNNAVLAVWGYSVCSINPMIDKMLSDFYNNIVGPYWDNARKLVEAHYDGIPFPFKEIATPMFYIKVNWKPEEFMGYLTTWSATQKYIKENGTDPVPFFGKDLSSHWGTDEAKEIIFPVFLKIGRIEK
jgi:hypothetical protein